MRRELADEGLLPALCAAYGLSPDYFDDAPEAEALGFVEDFRARGGG